MTGDDELQTLLDEAVDLARRAGQLTERWFQAPDLAVDTKADATPVTAADRAVERFLRTELAARHPADAIVGEEEEDRPGRSGRRWVIDPIDGTRSFTCGVPLFATLLALLEGDEPLVGVIHLPALGDTVAAARGRGCWVNGRPARVASGPRRPGRGHGHDQRHRRLGAVAAGPTDGSRRAAAHLG